MKVSPGIISHAQEDSMYIFNQDCSWTHQHLSLYVVLRSAAEANFSVYVSCDSHLIKSVSSFGLCHHKAFGPWMLSRGVYQLWTSQNRASQGQGLCSITLLIPFHLSFSSTTYPFLSQRQPTLSPLNFTPGLTPYFQNNHRSDTHSFPILQSGGVNRNWRFNFWNETQEAFWNWLPPPFLCLGACSSAPRQSLSPSWSAEYSQFLCFYGDVGEMATSKPSLGRKNKCPAAPTQFSQTPFLHACSFSSTELPSNALKAKGLFSVLLPAGCCVAI